MNISKYFILVFWIALFTGCSKTRYTQKQAKDLLAAVEKRYQQLDSYKVEGAINTTIKAAGQNRNSSISVLYAKKEPGKFHFEIKNPNTILAKISDGNMSWNYIPADKEYTQKRSSVIRTGDQGGGQLSTNFNSIVKRFIGSNKTISKNLKRAQILDEETLTTADGTEKDVYKVKLAYNDSRLASGDDMKIVSTRLWIDKQTHLVWKKSFESKSSVNSPKGPFKLYQTIVLTSFDLTPDFSASEFNFSPPEDAQKVDVLSFNKKGNDAGDRFEGEKAINFSLTSFQGKQISLADLRGKIVVLDFWATWCGPCREAHPYLQKLYSDYKDQGLIVMGINSEIPKKVDSYMQTHDYTFMNLKDPDQKTASNYGVRSIPSYFVIGRKGVVQSHLIGFQTEKQLLKAVKEAGL